jgi:hypothetical protein
MAAPNIGETLNAAVGPAVSALNRLASSLANPLQASVDRLGNAVSAAAGGLQQTFAGLNQAAGGVLGVFRGLGQAATGSPLRGMGEAAKGAGDMLKGAGAAMTGALNGAVGPLSALVDATRGFVEALSPGTMEAFNQAVSNLQATIGVAFEPIFTVLTDTLARVASTLAPVFETLRPIVEQVVQALSERLLTVVVTLANLFEAFAPFIRLAVDLYAALNPIINAVVAVVGALVEALLGFLAGLLGGEGGMRDFARQMADMIQRMTSAILLFVIQLGDALGNRNFGDAILRNLRPAERGREQVAAFRNVQTQDFSAITRQLAEAAAAASGQGAQRQDATNRDIVAELERNRGNQGEFIRWLQDALRAIHSAIVRLRNIGEAVTRPETAAAAAQGAAAAAGPSNSAAAQGVAWAWRQVFG